MQVNDVNALDSSKHKSVTTGERKHIVVTEEPMKKFPPNQGYQGQVPQPHAHSAHMNPGGHRFEKNTPDPTRTITQFLLNRLEHRSYVKQIYVTSSAIEREIAVYVVTDGENLEDRMDIMQMANQMRDLHPSWNLSPSIIARETDPDLDQIPSNARKAGDLLSSESLLQQGNAI